MPTAVRQRLKDLLAEYGRIALVVYLAIFAATWSGFAIAIGAGFDVDSAAGGTGVIGAAWVATKLTQPLRIGATLLATPVVAGVWHRVRGRRPAVEAAPAPAPSSDDRT
jgi:hypothetical protein